MKPGFPRKRLASHGIAASRKYLLNCADAAINFSHHFNAPKKSPLTVLIWNIGIQKMNMTDTDINRVYLSENFKVLGGVCSGIAISRGWSISLTRIVTIFAMSASLGAVLVVYLLAWMLLPPASARPYIESSQPPMDPLMRSERNRMLGGVCAGIADLLGVGAGTVRIVFMILLIFGGLSLAPYLYAWVVIPKRLH